MYGQEGGDLTLDSAPFACSEDHRDDIAERTANLTFFSTHARALKRGLDRMPLSKRGLVWNTILPAIVPETKIFFETSEGSVGSIPSRGTSTTGQLEFHD